MTETLHSCDPLQVRLAMLGSGLLGLAVTLLVGRVLRITERHVRTFAEDWEFEHARRLRLRNGSRIYRLTEPLIDELADSPIPTVFRPESIRLALARGGSPLPWHPKEFVAAAIVESLVLLLALLIVCSGLMGVLWCVVLGAGAAAVYLRSAICSVHRRADQRIAELHLRLPWSIDLIALMMRAGAGFRESLATVVDESAGHPFGEEFGRLLGDIRCGRTLSAALTHINDRLRSEDIREIVFSVRKSEELGTPLADTFENLADQQRLRKSQWAEAAAGRAQVQIAFPGLLIMIACLMTIVTPFLIGFFSPTTSG